MTLRLGGDGAITGCTSLENPDLTVSGLTISGSFDAEKVLVASGTAAAPSYTFSGDTDNGLYYAGTNSIGLATAGANAILIDSSSNVGIGTTSPSSYANFTNLTIQGGSSGSNLDFFNSSGVRKQAIVANASNGLSLECIDSGAINFNTNNTERARIDSSGRLLVGTSSATGSFSGIDPIVQIEGTSYDSSTILVYQNANDSASPGVLVLGKSRGTSSGSAVSVQNGDRVGVIEFNGADGTTRGVSLGNIAGFVDGTPGTNDMPGRLVFATTADGASSPTERMRIDSNGNVGIGGTPTVFGGQNFISIHSPGSSTNIAGIDLYVSGTRESGMLSYPSIGENLRIFGNTAQAITIHNNGSERMRIDSSGRVLINDSSVGTQRVDAPLQIETGSSGNAINLRARASDNVYSYINFTSNNNNEVSASIHLVRNASNNEGSLIFSTTKGGNTVPTEQLTINSIGRMSGQAVNVQKAFSLLYARLESHGGCSSGGPSGTFTEFDSGERAFVTVSRTTTTAPTNYLFFGDNYGSAFTLFVGCGDNPVFGTSAAANDAATYRSWICIHQSFTSAIGGLPTNATRTSLP